MWKILVLEESEVVIFRLCGRLEHEQLAELQRVFDSKSKAGNIVLDLRDVKLVDREAVGFLARREREGARLENCPGYIREWIPKENEDR
jgi:hypothetical protein